MRRSSTTRIVRPSLILLVVLWIQPCPAQEPSDHEQNLLREVYERAEEDVRRRVDVNIESLVKKSETRSNRPLTIDEHSAIRDFAVDAEYQKLVEMLTCIEKIGAIGGGSDLVESCYRERLRVVEAMFGFLFNYANADVKDFVLARCKAKTRLFQLEVRYPPYAFMLEDRKDAPQAVDAKAFLECARSPL
jgi:hypothetical protein